MASAGLSVSGIVNVTVSLAPIAAQYRNFGIPLFIGSSNIIDVNERMRVYATLEEVAGDFGTTAPEYLAADLYFSQIPQPAQLNIGRWAQAATNGMLDGAVLTAQQQAIGNFNAVTTGAFFIYVDGIPLAVSGLSFASSLNLNNVAATIQAALSSLASGSTVVWNGPSDAYFTIGSGTTGSASSVSYAGAPRAIGRFSLTGQPAANDTVTINGTVVTFVSGTPVGSQVQIGASVAATLQNLVAFLNTSSDTNIRLMTYSVVGTALYLVAVVTGTPGNAYTLAKSGTNITVSGATMSGGSGSDISTLLGLTAAAGAPPVIPGVNAETPVSCVALLDDIFSQQFYGVMFATSTPLSEADYQAVGGYIEGASYSHMFGVSTTNTNVLLSTVTTDTGSNLKGLNLSRTFTSYSSTNAYSAASIFGRLASIDFAGQNTALTVMFKQEPGVTPEILRESYAATLKDKNVNAFVTYVNDTSIVQWGVMANGWFIDERLNLDWLQNFVQTNVYNFLYQSPTKVPQTDAGMNKLVNVVNQSCAQAVVNGIAAPGIWDSSLEFGSLHTGDVLTAGYYTYAQPIANQSQADRAARKATAMQTAIKMAGAIHTANVAITANR